MPRWQSSATQCFCNYFLNPFLLYNCGKIISDTSFVSDSTHQPIIHRSQFCQNGFELLFASISKERCPNVVAVVVCQGLMVSVHSLTLKIDTTQTMKNYLKNGMVMGYNKHLTCKLFVWDKGCHVAHICPYFLLFCKWLSCTKSSSWVSKKHINCNDEIFLKISKICPGTKSGKRLWEKRRRYLQER